MTAREPTFQSFPPKPQPMNKPHVETNLIVGILLPLYEMQPEDEFLLAQQLMNQLVREYRVTVQSLLVLHGCQKTVTGPDETSQRWIDAYAKKYSASIARTFNKNLSAKIQALYRANKFGNRYYFYKALNAWIMQRNSYKLPSIALNTAQAARAYARDRFRIENNISGRFIMVGPPPTCEICIRIKALGAVTESVMINNPLPAHVGCPHEYQQLIPQRIDDCDEAWTG